MPNQPNSSAKNVTGDSATFEKFMRRLMQVPHSEIKAKLDAEKRTRVPKAVSPASVSPSKRES
jgi:hypothetical protein